MVCLNDFIKIGRVGVKIIKVLLKKTDVSDEYEDDKIMDNSLKDLTKHNYPF